MISFDEVKGVNGEIDESKVRHKYRCLTLSLIDKGLNITTMESCSCGQIASLLTDTEGASAILKGALITYSNEAKILEKVPKETIEKCGVYSPETALAMAVAAKEKFDADISVGVTGSFGNADINNADSVPGEVWFAVLAKGESSCFHCRIPKQQTRLDYKLYIADVIADRINIIMDIPRG